MLLPYLNLLNSKKVILGSQSKSRKFLLDAQNIKYQAFPSKFAEDLDKNSFECPEKYNLQTCKGKAADLLQTFTATKKQWDLLICGDTIVCYNNKIIQKPIDKQDCISMMSQLSGKTHSAYTAHVVVFNCEPLIRYEWVTKADVSFGDVPIQCLKAFADTEEPYIHSGGYQLTAMSGSFIKQINGSFTAVQGLDIYELTTKIIEGIKQVKWV